MAISDLKNDHKRFFALGFEFLFKNQTEYRQNGIAAAIGVKPPSITAIMRGYETKFPSYYIQVKIAELFKLEVHDIVEIGRCIEQGHMPNMDDNLKLIKEKSEKYIPKKPFNGYIDILDLPIKKRGIRIVELAAQHTGIRELDLSINNYDLNGNIFAPLKQFLDGETTEEQLYNETNNFFKSLKKQTDNKLKKHGLKTSKKQL